MTDRAYLMSAAKAAHEQVLLALADEAEEAGNLPAAKGFVWLYRHGKWPIERRDTDGVRGGFWYWLCSPQEGYADSHELPQAAWSRTRYPGDYGPLTFEEAMSWAAKSVGEVFGDEE